MNKIKNTKIQNGLTLYPSVNIDFHIKKNCDIVYLGEKHGDKESKIILKQLILYMHENHKLIDIAIEEDPAFKVDANKYINGQIDVLRHELLLRKDVLDVIREMNQMLLNSPLKVHLIDIDSPKSTIDYHLKQITNREILDKLEIVGLGEEYVPIDKTIELIDYLMFEEKNEFFLNELQNLKESTNLYHDGVLITEKSVRLNRNMAPRREKIISDNIISVKKKIGEKPLLVFIGGAHAAKTNQFQAGSYNQIVPSAQQVIDKGFIVYSIALNRISGSYNWRGKKDSDNMDLEEIVFQNGKTLDSILQGVSQYKLLRFNLYKPKNKGISFSSLGFKPGMGHLVYDELLLINEATAMD